MINNREEGTKKSKTKSKKKTKNKKQSTYKLTINRLRYFVFMNTSQYFVFFSAVVDYVSADAGGVECQGVGESYQGFSAALS